MKKVLGLILWMMIFVVPAQASLDERVDENMSGVGRSWHVFKRGAVNLVMLPTEVISSFSRETDAHSKAWPATILPRTLMNVFNRSASIVNDVFFMPWYAPHTTDLRPLTRSIGLPDYPWQKEID